MPFPDGTATPAETAIVLAYCVTAVTELQNGQEIALDTVDCITLKPGVMVFRFDLKPQADTFVSLCSAYFWAVERQGDLDVKLGFARDE